MRTRKPAKDFKSMLQTIKKFIAGQDITDEVLGWSRHLDKLSAEQLNELLRIKVSGESFERKKEMLREAGILDTLEGKQRPTWFKVETYGEENMRGKPSWYAGPEGDRYEVDGKECSCEEYEQRIAEEKAKGNFFWQEIRNKQNRPLSENSESIEQIERSESIESSNSEELSLDAIIPQKKKEAKIEAVMKPGGKEFLQAKLKEFEEQEKIDLADREEMLIWKAMNHGDIKIIR